MFVARVYVPGEVIITGAGLFLAAVIWLFVGLGRVAERIARIEGRLNGRKPEEANGRSHDS